MTDYSLYSDAEHAVNDPATTAKDLAEIAEKHPALWEQVAGHPAAYRGLLEWLAEVGDDDVLAVIAARSPSGIHAHQKQAPDIGTPEAPEHRTSTAADESPMRLSSLVNLEGIGNQVRKWKGSRVAWIVSGGTLVLIIALIVTLVVWQASRGSDDQTQQVISQVPREQTPTDDQDPCAGGLLPEGVDERVCGGAPGGAISLPSHNWYGQMFEMPSHNVGCYTYFGGVSCEIASKTWKTPTSFIDKCTNTETGQRTGCDEKIVNLDDTGSLSIVAHDGTAPWAAAKKEKSKIVILQYGQTATFSFVACLSEFEGVTCWHTTTHHGFKMSKSTFKHW